MESSWPHESSTFNESNQVPYVNFAISHNHTVFLSRVPFIRDGLTSLNVTDPAVRHTASSLRGLNLLEVGCGAGILTEV